MKKYFIKNGVINIIRYIIKYTEIRELDNKSYTTTGTIYVNSKYELETEKAKLDTRDAEYTIETIDVSSIEKFDKVEVSSIQEAEDLINPSIDKFISDKIIEISNSCEETIFNGIDVKLENGETKHFSLKSEDQTNMNALYAQIKFGEITEDSGVPYHADGEYCRFYSVKDFITIADTASMFKIQQTTYCNHLMQYVKTLKTKEEIEVVKYGQELTGEALESYNTILAGLLNSANK